MSSRWKGARDLVFESVELVSRLVEKTQREESERWTERVALIEAAAPVARGVNALHLTGAASSPPVTAEKNVLAAREACDAMKRHLDDLQFEQQFGTGGEESSPPASPQQALPVTDADVPSWLQKAAAAQRQQPQQTRALSSSSSSSALLDGDRLRQRLLGLEYTKQKRGLPQGQSFDGGPGGGMGGAAMALVDFAMRGWLFKMQDREMNVMLFGLDSGGAARWSRRFFVMAGGSLYYYRSEEDPTPVSSTKQGTLLGKHLVSSSLFGGITPIDLRGFLLGQVVRLMD